MYTTHTHARTHKHARARTHTHTHTHQALACDHFHRHQTSRDRQKKQWQIHRKRHRETCDKDTKSNKSLKRSIQKVRKSNRAEYPHQQMIFQHSLHGHVQQVSQSELAFVGFPLTFLHNNSNILSATSSSLSLVHHESATPSSLSSVHDTCMPKCVTNLCLSIRVTNISPAGSTHYIHRLLVFIFLDSSKQLPALLTVESSVYQTLAWRSSGDNASLFWALPLYCFYDASSPVTDVRSPCQFYTLGLHTTSIDY